jgi:hypothetical protein
MSDAAPVPYEPLPESRLRVGDAERYEAAKALGEHFATGRLDQVEYDTRVQDAYGARTRGDLERLFSDLPAPAPFRPAPPPGRTGWEAGRAAREGFGGHQARRFPVPPVVLILAIFVLVSVIARFPVFPLLLLLWFGWGRRAWR